MKIFFGLAALWLSLGAYAHESRVIKGEIIPREYRPEVVTVSVGGAKCTGTVVGPRIVLTTAHCGQEGGKAEIDVLGKSYQGTFIRSSVYPKVDHDLGMIIMNEVIANVQPASISGQALIGEEVSVFGYGCTNPGGSGGMDGQLRTGKATIEEYNQMDFVTKGAALCFGDSGGPAYANENGHYVLRGVGSKGNIKETSYWVDLSLKESQDLFSRAKDEFAALVCGYHLDCQPLEVEQPGPVAKLEFKQEVFQIAVKSGSQVWVDLKTLLENSGVRFDRLWFLDPLAPQWLEINQEKEILHGIPAERGMYRFSIGVRTEKLADAAIIELKIN